MRHTLHIAVVGIALALAGSGGALARAAHHRYGRLYSRAYSRRAVRPHTGIIGNRRTHVYSLTQSGRNRLASRNRIYFPTVAEARAAGYYPARRSPIPIDPRLSWHGTRRLPSLGKHHMPPQPQPMDKPVAPPHAQQPSVTPTNPMPN